MQPSILSPQHQKIWNQAEKFLKQGISKDYVSHTKYVVEAMQLILKKEKGNEKEKVDPEVLIPAAILHDTGWARVPKDYQLAKDDAGRAEALRLHLEHAAPIIKEILSALDYLPEQIAEITTIVQAHKSTEPENLNQKLLIDADQLSDAFSAQFESDMVAYKVTAKQLYEFRMKNNIFHTKIARALFEKMMAERKQEA